ncbi:MAG: YicC family protein [Gammaproteobacteria bacterium]|uniref:YicC/YloC family endoribonuclease n=1 Tax=Hydrogenophaga sp. TaxID=1904254 RepID=UPI000CBC8118|nr:YicC/YloC family endoribonuclease [Hydrogenophaga sp.]MBU4180458.1 YicC family protein [Gammaproteobacteria bacterium]PKO77274.1 MAG: YicC family protein [Betaproteobacteria bacterium HGW-Betaproteobacteria-15]MBU4281012.1 YicC family protein [Gammaproteobacteria bacterium]MBU4325484.1 YicC family protein [Gammaproteobacteria bacterium]MBU4508552.1 YicC family protein [Gammaproteobacteria bacterium]
MAVYSMTGYATAQTGGAAATNASESPRDARPGLGIEIRSVNSRFLDLTFKLADDLRGTEPALRELLGAALKRGKVEVRAWVEGRTDAGPRAPSAPELQKLVSLQDNIRAWLPTAAPLSVAEVLQLTTRQAGNPGELHETLLALAQTGLDKLLTAREREGQRLAAMLLDRLKQLRQLAKDAQPLIPQLVAQQRQRFIDRWNEALGASAAAGGTSNTLTSEAAQDRALTEATAFAIRIDVAEELTRLDSHLVEIERLIKKGSDVGKRLDFLIQELHREANTMGSKSSSLELTRISVDMKVLIEQMREQVQNIE